MADDGSVWVKVYPEFAANAAVIGMSSVGVDNAPDGKPAGATDLSDGSYTYSEGGKTYRVLAFTTATTTASIRLTDDARAKITDEDLLMAIASTKVPDDFTGDPVELFDKKFRKQLRNAFEVTAAVDPGLTLDVQTAGFIDFVLIGGGGGAGMGNTNYGAGGAGAAGYIEDSVYLSAKSHSVVIGAGGAKGTSTGGRQSSNGNPSALGIVVATGGKCGRSGFDAMDTDELTGSGRGGGGGSSNVSALNGTSGFPNQGNDGGAGYVTSTGSNTTGGGGGGAGSAGVASVAGNVGGNGGSGVFSSITGTAVERAGGGGGSGANTAGTASGGGGAGATNGAGTDGTPGTGGGGGAGRSAPGGIGGSGILVVRVEV